MLKVMVCDGNKRHRDTITSMVENTIVRENLEMDMVASTANGSRILDILRGSPTQSPGIYFISIDNAGDMNGLILSEEIRNIDANGFIILFSSSRDSCYSIFNYRIEPMDFIIKDATLGVKERIISALLAIENRANSNQEGVFSIKSQDKIVKLRLEDVLFFETSPTIHKIVAHEANRQIEFYGKMKELEERLHSRFYRCHKSYIVNLDKIKEIDKSMRVIHLIDGKQCLVSQRELRNMLKESTLCA